MDKEEEDAKVCEKCGGEGWVWDWELDEFPEYTTDQRYTCDRCKGRK